MPSKEDDARKRDDSINIATPGHWWSGYRNEQPKVIELNPGNLNLNDVQDFLKFLGALNRGEQKAHTFLSRMPQRRIDQLKSIHEALGAQLLALGE